MLHYLDDYNQKTVHRSRLSLQSASVVNRLEWLAYSIGAYHPIFECNTSGSCSANQPFGGFLSRKDLEMIDVASSCCVDLDPYSHGPS